MKFVPNAVSTQVARGILQSQKASPKMMFAAGIVGFGATVYLACRATLRVEEVLEKHEKAMLDVLEIHTEGLHEPSEAKKDKAYVYLRTTRELTVLYGPAVLCGALTISSLIGSHNILSKRNAGLTAAYASLEKAFNGYRDRVRASVGEKKEQEIYHDVTPCEIEDENGKIVKKKVANGAAPYSFLFDQSNPNWSPMPEYNFLFLRMKEEHFTQQLRARGHLFLNEVLRELGFEHTKAGAVTGWVQGKGDDYVDFGIFNEGMEERVIEFMVGREKGVWLCFNVDGVIYDKI